MDKPRIFLGSSGKQAKLLQALTRGLEEVAHVEPWTTSFNPGTTTLERLLELTREVDFAAFVFAHDHWTTISPPASDPWDPARLLLETTWSSKPVSLVESSACAEHSSSMRAAQSFQAIFSVSRAYTYEATTTAEMRVVNEKLRKAIENEGHAARIEGLWWQFSLTERSSDRAFGREPLANLAKPRRGAGSGGPLMARGWHAVSAILERSGEGEEGSFRPLLLLERRTAPAPERAAVGRHGRNPPRVCRSRGRVLDNSLRHSPAGQRANVRCLPARRSRGHKHPGRTGRSETRRVDCRAADRLEVENERLRRSRSSSAGTMTA